VAEIPVLKLNSTLDSRHETWDFVCNKLNIWNLDDAFSKIINNTLSAT
jgi:hypothetical protein